MKINKQLYYKIIIKINIVNRGFSIGVSDVQPSEILSEKKRQLIDAGYKKCDVYLDRFKNGKLNVKPGMTAEQTLEVSFLFLIFIFFILFIISIIL